MSEKKRDEVSPALRVATLGFGWGGEVVTNSGCSSCKVQRQKIVRSWTLLRNHSTYHNNINVKLFPSNFEFSTKIKIKISWCIDFITFTMHRSWKLAYLGKCGTELVGIIRNWFTLVDLFETTRIKGLDKMDCIADEAAIIKELL